MGADGSPAALHSVATCEWYTPAEIVHAARVALGEIDLDPASCEIAQRTVRASRYYAAADDGLAHEWSGRVFCNPPSPPRPWFERASGPSVTRCVFVGYSIEVLQQFQPDCWHWCIPKSRIRYMTTAAGRMEQLRTQLAKADAKLGMASDSERVKLRGRISKLTLEIEALSMMPADSLVRGDSPAHASVILGRGMAAYKFAAAFESIGVCR